ncbi:MAG TPA: hypothetical protein VKT49_25490 [Bryobacteraceae bacterium]|nr:hypothetical protein [Bryobacteraceae bacterium]
MSPFHRKQAFKTFVCLAAVSGLLAVNSFAQYPGVGGTGGTPPTAGAPPTGGMPPTSGMPPTGGGYSPGPAGGGPTGIYNFHSNYHLGFDRPEAWGLKYFASASLLSGLQPPSPPEGYHLGSVTVGFEVGWLPTLDPGQRQIGFNGATPEDLNKAPIFARPVVRVGLPAKFTAVVAAPPPFQLFGLTPKLLEFGLERPLLQRDAWTVSWRGYGQVGSVKGAFTCPKSVLSSAPGSAGNPTQCVGESADVASLRYAGSEFQVAYKIPSMPKLIPHAGVGGNFIDGVFQVHAPVVSGLDETRLWTRGGTFSSNWGISYLITKRAAITVDAFYSPLWVQRHAIGPTTNDGLFNVRALLSYSFR